MRNLVQNPSTVNCRLSSVRANEMLKVAKLLSSQSGVHSGLLHIRFHNMVDIIVPHERSEFRVAFFVERPLYNTVVLAFLSLPVGDHKFCRNLFAFLLRRRKERDGLVQF